MRAPTLDDEPTRQWDPADELPCRAHDPELWFAEDPAQIAVARALCGDCPLRTACLTGAVERREPWGVWGGELFERGTIVARKRPRGRPRKDDGEAARRAAADLAVRLADLRDVLPHDARADGSAA